MSVLAPTAARVANPRFARQDFVPEAGRVDQASVVGFLAGLGLRARDTVPRFLEMMRLSREDADHFLQLTRPNGAGETPAPMQLPPVDQRAPNEIPTWFNQRHPKNGQWVEVTYPGHSTTSELGHERDWVSLVDRMGSSLRVCWENLETGAPLFWLEMRRNEPGHEVERCPISPRLAAALKAMMTEAITAQNTWGNTTRFPEEVALPFLRERAQQDVVYYL